MAGAHRRARAAPSVHPFVVHSHIADSRQCNRPTTTRGLGLDELNGRFDCPEASVNGGDLLAHEGSSLTLCGGQELVQETDGPFRDR